MTAAHRWVRWALRPRGAGMTKVPLTLTGRHASSTRPSTWTTHTAAGRSRTGAGAGYVLGAGVGCYDFDGALHRGQLTAWARQALASIPEPVLYAEVSQSGCGLHVFVAAPPGRGTVTPVAGGRIERYTTGRFIAMTGVPFDLPNPRAHHPLEVALSGLR